MSPTGDGKLSKEEVEALLQATREQEELPAERVEPARRVHHYDFLQPSRFNKSALEKLRKINDALAQNATTHASRLLRTSVKTQLVSMDQMKWENLLEEAGDTVVGFVFTMVPIGHRGIVTLGRQFAVACLDRMMGGTGEVPDAAADFTELDVRTFAAFVRGILAPLPELWQNIGRFQVELGPFVADVQSLDLFPPAEDLFQLCFLMQGSIGSGQVAVAVPFQAVRSLPPQSEEVAAEQAIAASEEAVEEGLRESLKRTTVELTVMLGAADIKMAKLVGVGPGDVIVLHSRIGDALEVKVNDKVKFRGYPGVSSGKYGVKLIMEE